MRLVFISFKVEDEGVVKGLRLLASTDTYTSKGVGWELETAIELKKPIVAMAVEGVGKAALPGPIRART